MPNRYKASSFNGVASAFDGNLYHIPQEQYQPMFDHHHFPPAQHFAGPPPPLQQQQHQQHQQQHQQQPMGTYRASEPHFVVQPRLVRASTLAEAQSALGTKQNQFDPRVLNVKVTLSFCGAIGSMTTNWTEQERHASRRLVLISWTQEYSHLQLGFRPIAHKDYLPGMPVLSCIYWADTDKYYVTSVDLITLLEHLVHARFPVEEKNRIRRNLQSLKPLTITKGNDRFHSFFQLIMQYDSPKPRHIEKDVKVLYWSAIEDALSKVLSKYTVDPCIEPTNSVPPQGPFYPQAPPLQMSSAPNEPYTQDPQFPPHVPQFFNHMTEPHLPPPPPHPHAFGPGVHFPGHYSTASTGSSQLHQNSIVDPLTPANSSINSASITPPLQPAPIKTETNNPSYPMAYAYPQQEPLSEIP